MASVIPHNQQLFCGAEPVSSDAFFQRVATLRASLRAQIPAGKAARVLLFESDITTFLSWLIALGLEQHVVVLPPNDKEGTIADIASNIEFTAGSVVADGKTALQVMGSEPAVSEPFSWPTAGELVFFTSGSSGQPKPIVKCWTHINNELETLVGLFSFASNSVFMSTVSHQHIYGLLFRALLPLRLGNSIFPTFEYPEHLAETAKGLDSVVLISSPAFLTRLASDNVLSAIKERFSFIFSSGGPLKDADAIELAQQMAQGITQVYGSTESGGIAYRQVTSSSDKLWQCFPGVSLHSRSEDERLILSSLFIQESQLLLDDTGRITDGMLELCGRVDRTIKLEEKRINLTQIEVKCKEHIWVEDVRLLAINGKRVELAAVIHLNSEGLAALAKQGKRFLNQNLKAYLSQYFELITLPRKWRYVEALPYNSQGKLPVIELEKLFV